MVRNSRIKGTDKIKVSKIFFIIVCLGIVACWTISGLVTQYRCAIVVRNSKYVLSDSSKLAIDYINSNDKIFLEDTSSIDGDSIDEYIPVVKGTGTYYIPDNLMTRELSSGESAGFGRVYSILCVVVFVLIHIVLWKIHKHRLFTVFMWVLMSMVMWVVLSYWVESVLLSSFPVGIIVVIGIAEFTVYSLILNKRRKR